MYKLATGGVYHPNRNGTYIQIFESTNPSTPVWQIDCGYSTDVSYNGRTVSFVVRNASWIPGAVYYILFGSGAASGNIFCAPESDPING
jgi:archaellum component FlaF (FlaF/FlaG flagellin family)